MIKAILFNGPPESGKDTAADFFQQHWQGNTVRHKMSVPLQKVLRGVTGDYVTPYEELKRQMFPGGDGRQIMIDAFNKVIKPIMGEDYLGHYLGKNVLKNDDPSDLALVTDAGRQDEVDAFMGYTGYRATIIVSMMRDGKTFEGDSRQPIKHCITENQFIIPNNGSLAELERRMHELAIELGLR